MKLKVSLSPWKVTRFLLLIVFSLATLSFLTHLSNFFFPNYPLKYYSHSLVNVDGEGNIPTLYSALTLLFSGLLLGLIAYVKKQDNSRYARHWGFLSGVFCFLSFDELFQFHEQLISPTRKLLGATGFLYFTWVVPAAFLLVILGLSYVKFLGHLPAKTRTLFMLGAGLYIGGAIGAELIGGNIAFEGGMNNLSYHAIATFEELCEMLGVVTFIHALTSYISNYLNEVIVQVRVGKELAAVRQKPSEELVSQSSYFE
ncbi:hypothetical protein NG798_07395 [Ancylothrix sp. C2]|uniref:hypothetical protein n=1 Tax=Ancylothrix sp. D3o TaxID=2953691 RepID=UPI0021BB9017|nr:hypothetical protein [Ancylothrix sp. D3o]MCT7949607.1 hypothetical protein [Ancylothrix sp. D3o]